MKLKFSSCDFEVDLSNGCATCVEIHNKTYFTRIVYSLLSGLGEEALEPYFLFDEKGKSINTKSNLIVINNLPLAPTSDKKIISKIWDEVAVEMKNDIEAYDEFISLANRMFDIIRIHSFGLHSQMNFDIELDERVLMKTFGFSPQCANEARLIDNLISFFEMLVDGYCVKPIVFVNLKEFLDKKDFEALLENSFLNKIPLILLESCGDSENYEREEKIIVDQDFIVFDQREFTG